MSLYLSYSEAFQPRSGEQYKTFSGDSDKFNPDVMENTEIGFKYDLDAGASLAVSYFTMDQTQAKSYDNGTGEVTEEAGMEIDGFEINNSSDFSMFLLEKAHVATVTGSAFGCPNNIRISYAASKENITEAIKRIKAVLA